MQPSSLAVPTGKLELPVVTRLRAPARRPTVETAPSRATRAWLAFAADLVAHVGTADAELTRRSLPPLLEDAVQANSRLWDGEGLLRRGLALGHAAAMTYLSRCQRPGLRLDPARLDRLAETVTSRGLRQRVSAAAPAGARLGLVAAGGPAEGLLLDRLHYTHLAGLVLCGWMAPQVEADVQLGLAVAGTAFRGVRVVCAQAFASSVHVTAGRDRHPFGGCPDCTPAGAFA